MLKVNVAMLCSALVLSSFSLQGHASFVDLGTTTVDTSSNLEWLDLTESMGYSFNQVVNDNIFPTWRYATLSELQALYSGFGFNVERAYYQPASNGPQGAVDLATSLLGDTYGDPTGQTRGVGGIIASAGFTSYSDSFKWRLGVEEGSDLAPYGSYLAVDLLVTGSGVGIGVDNPSAGHYLVREYEGASPVPLPAAVWLFGSGLMALFGFRMTNRINTNR
jgi:hypothetical protein